MKKILILIVFISACISPISSQKNKIEAMIYVEFVINKDGQVADVHFDEDLPPIKIGDTITPGLTLEINEYPPILIKEAIRSVSSIPKWNPGKHQGRAVRVSYTLPINFSLN